VYLGVVEGDVELQRDGSDQAELVWIKPDAEPVRPREKGIEGVLEVQL
jgi:hypothetical protein